MTTTLATTTLTGTIADLAAGDVFQTLTNGRADPLFYEVMDIRPCSVFFVYLSYRLVSGDGRPISDPIFSVRFLLKENIVVRPDLRLLCLAQRKNRHPSHTLEVK